MDKKVTRRVVLGTIVAGLAAGPFVISGWHRRRRFQLPEDSFLAGLRTRFEPALSFPRKFDTVNYDGRGGTLDGGSPEDIHREALEYFKSLPKSVQNTIVETQRRY